MIFPKPWRDLVARLRVPSGFLLVAAFGWLARPSPESLIWGLPVSAAGLALRAWAAGHLAKNQNLATGGPYAWIRNPLYVGTLMVAAGLVIAARNIVLGVLFAAVFLLVYLPVIQNEEQHLRKIFPEYADYAARVPALIPHRPPSRTGRQWQAKLYVKNQEYQALAGFLAGLGWLVYKAL